MQSTLKVFALVFTATLLFSSVNFAQNNQSVLVFTALRANGFQGLPVSVEPYPLHPATAEVHIASMELPTAKVNAVLIDLDKAYRVQALTELMNTLPDFRLIIDKRDVKSLVTLNLRDPRQGAAFWVNATDIKIDIGDGNLQPVSQVTDEYLHQLELKKGVYHGFYGFFVQQAIDQWNCAGTFAENIRCKITHQR